MIVIGLGHKARQGKDTVANFIKELHPDKTTILHFADALYNECYNRNSRYPLIIQMKNDRYALKSFEVEHIYAFLDKPHLGKYEFFFDSDMPVMDELFLSRGICVYDGMKEKDPPMLQAWGTEYRRAYDKNYWINRTDLLMQAYHIKDPNCIVVIPDTRFENEVEYIETISQRYPGSIGKYIKVERLNDDGTQFIDPSRDHGHPSEVELDGAPSWRTIKAKSGDLYSLNIQSKALVSSLEQLLADYKLLATAKHN